MNSLDLFGKVTTYQTFKQTGLPLFHVSSFLHRVGESFATGRSLSHPHMSFFMAEPPPEWMVLADFRARRNAEAVFEQVRAARFSRLPSRKHALFASISLEDTRFWKKTDTRRDGHVYELILTDSSMLTLVDLGWFNYAVRVNKTTPEPNDLILRRGGTLQDELLAAAENYWAGVRLEEHNAVGRTEVLIHGVARIVREIGSI